MIAHILISSSLCHNDTVYKEWLQSYQLVHGIACGNIILLKFEITKYWCDLENKVNVFKSN